MTSGARPLDRFARYTPIIVSWVLALIVLLIVATLEATDRSRDRAECYRVKQSIEACPKPANWEKKLAWLLS